MKIRRALLTCLLLAVAPAAADAATFTADRPCYSPGERVGLSGGGFTPDGPVAVSADGRQLGVTAANAVGEVEAAVPAPRISVRQRVFPYVATDQTDLALTATAPVKVSSLAVNVTPKRGRPDKPRRIVARGFTSGRVLYAHVKRGKSTRTVRVGRLRGDCHTLTAKRRMFAANSKTGVYRVQFDTKRRFSPKTRPNMTFFVTVFRVLRRSSASAAASAGATTSAGPTTARGELWLPTR